MKTRTARTNPQGSRRSRCGIGLPRFERGARKEHIHEIELKLILSSTLKGWNFTENTLAAKNLANSPWEFGYASAPAVRWL